MKAVPFNKFPFWLAGAVLYGISWPLPWDVNFSFLAWFAFVFLFLSLKGENTFWRFLGKAWLFSFVAYTICSGWFLSIPTNKILIFVGAASESLVFPIAFVPLYFLKRRSGFKKSLVVLPFLFVLGEALYCSMEHNLGYLRVVHSQTANPWLIQYVDLFGSLSVTFWVVVFNVSIYSILEKCHYRFLSRSFVLRTVVLTIAMVSLPLGYAAFRNHQIKLEKTDSLRVTMIHTSFAPNPRNDEQIIKNLDRIVELTDSVSYHSCVKGKQPDLYVWYEGAIPSGNNSHIRSFVQSAVNDWQVPLLTGMKYLVRMGDTDAWQPVNRVVLFQPKSDSTQPLLYYDKIHLAPGWEFMPYLSVFHKLGIRFAREFNFHRKGDRFYLFEVSTGTRHVRFGTPICFEQNAPSIWNRMVLLGADCFVQVSFESWFGGTYFQKQVAYITRLRAIETRRSVARSSNGGLTFFVDSFGEIYSMAPIPESEITDSLSLSNTITFFTKHQNLFPLMCLVASMGLLVFLPDKGKRS